MHSGNVPASTYNRYLYLSNKCVLCIYSYFININHAKYTRVRQIVLRNKIKRFYNHHYIVYYILYHVYTVYDFIELYIPLCYHAYTDMYRILCGRYIYYINIITIVYNVNYIHFIYICISHSHTSRTVFFFFSNNSLLISRTRSQHLRHQLRISNRNRSSNHSYHSSSTSNHGRRHRHRRSWTNSRHT